MPFALGDGLNPNHSSGIGLSKTCVKMFGTGWDITGLCEQDSGRVYLILSQNKAKMCGIIVTMPTRFRHSKNTEMASFNV